MSQLKSKLRTECLGLPLEQQRELAAVADLVVRQVDGAGKGVSGLSAGSIRRASSASTSWNFTAGLAQHLQAGLHQLLFSLLERSSTR
jgi:hypothetical protein